MVAADYFVVGRLVDLVEDKDESGKSLEQWPIIELDNGQRVVMMDVSAMVSNSPVISRRLLGKRIRVGIGFNLVGDVADNPRRLKGMYGFRKAGDHNGIIAGQVVKIDSSFCFTPILEGTKPKLVKEPCRKIFIDIGTGEEVNLDSHKLWVKVGDFVQAEVFRIDVSDEVNVEVLE